MKNKTKISAFIAILSIALTSIQAQQTLSLEEFTKIALENNFSIRISENQERIAINNYNLGNAGLLPTFGFRSSYSGNFNNSDQNFTDETSASLRSIHNTSAFMGLHANWVLFEGFRGINRYKQLGELKNLSELNTRASIENMLAQLASEYYFYIQQKRLFSNLQYAVDLSRERVRIEKEHFLLGSGSKVQLLQAQVNLNADSSRLERQYEVLLASRIRLSEIIAEPDFNNGKTPADTVIEINPNLKYEELLTEAFKQNVAILAAEKNIIISEYNLELIKSREYPYLNLNTGYGYNLNTYQSGTISDMQSWGMNYAITLGVNIYYGKERRAKHSNARIEIENNTISLERIKQEVTADLLTIYNTYSNNIRLLDLEVQNLEIAKENLDIAFERYRLGALTGFELREVQKNLLEAEERLLTIQYRVKMAEISLLQISGNILN